jgi:hypothetical protein
VNRTDALVDVRRTLHERLIGRMDARQLDAMPRAERRLRVREEALSLLREQGHMLPQNALADVVNAVSDAVVGMGPIEFLLKDPEVTEGLPSTRTPDARQSLQSLTPDPLFVELRSDVFVPRLAPSCAVHVTNVRLRAAFVDGGRDRGRGSGWRGRHAGSAE